MCRWLHSSFLEISKPLTFHRKSIKLLHDSFLEISNHESVDSSGARACGTPDKASKAASNLSEPTCKAANGVEVSPAKPKPTTSPKLKPAASIEQSSNRIEPSNRTLEASKVSYGAPRRPPQAAAGRRRLAKFRSSKFLDIIKT